MDKDVLDMEKIDQQDDVMYNPTVQPLETTQKKGYYPVEKIPQGVDLTWMNSPERQYDKKDWYERFSAAFKNTWADFVNNEQRKNATLGALKIINGKTKEEVEYGRQMTVDALTALERLEEGLPDLSPEQMETFAAQLGAGAGSMAEFVAVSAPVAAMTGPIGEKIAEFVVTRDMVFKEGVLQDIQKYIDETGDMNLENYKGSKEDVLINEANADVQGVIEVIGDSIVPLAGRMPGINKLSKPIVRKMMETWLGRALLRLAEGSTTNYLEEYTQTAPDNIAQILKNNEKLTWGKIWEGADEAGLIGAILGGGEAAVHSAAQYELGYRRTRNFIENKLVESAKERGIEVSPDEIHNAATELTNAIESEGVQIISDNTQKVLGITDSESDVAQKLTRAFEDLVNQGAIRFRGMTEDEVRQAGLDWANWMQARAILDSLDRGIALSEHPLNNAVAELDRIYLEGRNAGEGDLLTLDINNAQVQYLAEQIDDFIQKSQQSREQAEAARIEALREAELNARLETVRELERNAMAELEKARLEQNEEAIANLTLDLNMLTARVDSLTSELQGLITNRQQNTGRISIKQAKGLESPRKTPTKNAGDKYVSVDGKSTVKTETIKNRNGTEKEKITITTPDGQSKQIFVSQQQDGSYLMWWTDNAEGKGQKQAYYDNDEWLSPDDAKKKFNKKLSGGQVDLSQIMESELGFTERNNLTADQVKQGLEKMGVRENDGGDSAAGGVLQFQDLPPQLQEQFRLAEENARMDEMYPEYTGDTIEVDGKVRTVYNSEGKRINKSAEALTNFWRWFGDSKVVDEQGRPLVVYHGTNAEFDTFEKDRVGDFGKGYYFTTSRESAEQYAARKGGDIVVPVYLSIKNVYESPANAGQFLYNLRDKKTSTKQAQGVLLEQGFDGIEIKQFSGKEKYFVAFEPNQIKSVNNLGYYSSADDRLDYQRGFVSLKGEMEGDYIDANKHLDEGEGGSAWAWGNYFLASRRLDEENYYKRFSRQGPDLRYDGELVNSADFFNKRGIYHDNTREIVSHATHILDTKEHVITKLEDNLAKNKEKFDKHIENVVKRFESALGEKRTKEIIDDIIKIISGKGFAVGPLATFNKELQPEEYKIQQKYRDDSGRLSDDVVDIYKALIDEFGGNHWFDTDYFTHDLLNLRQQEKSLEAVKKLDWDKFTGKIGMTYKGQDVAGVLGSAVAKTVGNTGTYEAHTMIPRILELFRDSLSKNKEIKTELTNLEKPIKEIADTASTAKKEIKEKLKEILADKTLQTRRFYEGANVKEVEKELLAFVDGTNTADYYSFADLRDKNNWDISSPEAMLADAVLWSRFNKKNYPENITKEADTNLIDLAYAIREANTKLAILKAAQKEFVNNKDFVYKPTASMYRSDAIPENKFLLDMGKSLEEQPSYVKDAIIKLYTETGVGIEPITWENIRLINPALPRIYNAKEILPDPKSEDFKSDKMRTINLYDNAADRFAIKWRNRGLDYAVKELGQWVKMAEQQRDDFKAYINRTDFPQNVREANERAYLEEADIASVLKFLYEKVSKIPKDANINDYIQTDPQVLDNTTGKSYYRQLEESLGKESNKAVFDSLNAKTAHEAASKLLLRYGIRGVRYWGKSDHRGFVTFEPTPVNEKLLQETLNNDTLMAVHSMSLEGAMKALDLGGMAMPSMAITKVQDGVRGLYGDVVLLGDVRLAAPSRTTDVYDRDAWTPVVNSIIYEFDSDMYKKIQDLLEAKGQNKNAASSYTHNIAASMTDGSDPRNNTMAVELFAIYKGIDQDTAREQIKYNWDKPFTPLHEEYIQWYNDFLLKNAKAYIHMGWTPSGAVRKKPLNLENLVAEMKTQDRYARMGGDYFTPGDVLKFNLVRFKNLQEVRDAQGRIVPTEEAVEATREMGSRFFALASELKPDNVEGYDATDQRLAYALIYGKGSMKERLEGNGLKSDPESVKKVEQFVKDIKSMPVKYFEVKPRRAVRFDEFSGAILPTSEEYDVLEERLRDNGMRFVYRADTQEQKNAALQDLYKQNPFVLFQNKKTSASKTGLGKEYRGAYDPLTRAILFSKVSDVSTLFHESAHYWFDRNLRYYKTGMASPEWKDRWEKVMEELGVVPNARGYVTAASVKAGSEKFARSMEAYLKTGEYENAAMQWAHQDYKNMVGRVYRNLWKNYWGLEDLSPAVKDWFNMNGFDVSNPMTAFAEKTTMDTAEEDIGNIVAIDETKPDVPAVVQEEADAANGQVVENRKGEVAIVPEDEYETDQRVHSKLPESAERATGVEMEPIVFNRRSMSDSLRAARDLVDRDPVRAWEALKAGDDMIDGLYAGDIYRALISKYKEENNPTMIKTVVQSFANAARRAGRSVKAFDLETPTVSYEGTISSLNKVFATKSNDAKVNELVKQIKNFLHEPEALNKGWEKFKEELECK